MKASAGGYARANDVRQALDLLAAADGAGRVLAGGQSLISAMNMRLSVGDLLVDISRIAALRGVREDGDRLIVGALTRHAEVALDPLVRRHAPLLARAVGLIAHPAIRNRGTIGGAIAHADPAAEFPACALALEAEMILEGPAGVRRVVADEFFIDVFETAIAPGEILTAIAVPKAAADEVQTIRESARRSGDYALAGVCLRRRGGLHRVSAFSVAPRPVLLRGAMERLDADDLEGAVKGLVDELEPPSDTQASAAYRLHLTGVMLRRAAADLEGAAQ